ncbi:MAG: hypothetical protein LUC41_03285 [Clostridiales bacterium]|nr:hypothetical protein [Clostridiales bacterium]
MKRPYIRYELCSRLYLPGRPQLYVQDHVYDHVQEHDTGLLRLCHINGAWCGDIGVGPSLQTEDGSKHRVSILIIMDEVSDLIVGADLFFNVGLVDIMSVMKSAVAKYGWPYAWHFGKACSDTWFRHTQKRWEAALDMRDFHSLDELRDSFYAYVQRYNWDPCSRREGISPIDCFFSEPEYIHRLSQEEFDNSFLFEVKCQISEDNAVIINNVEYEVDHRFAEQCIRIRYSLDMKRTYLVGAYGDLAPIRLLKKHEKACLNGGED